MDKQLLHHAQCFTSFQGHWQCGKQHTCVVRMRRCNAGRYDAIIWYALGTSDVTSMGSTTKLAKFGDASPLCFLVPLASDQVMFSVRSHKVHDYVLTSELAHQSRQPRTANRRATCRSAGYTSLSLYTNMAIRPVHKPKITTRMHL